jgi:hypothetical protein
MKNIRTELTLTQDGQGNIKATPNQPVVLIECVPDSCDDAVLNLKAVIKHYDGKVKIVAVNPYKESQVAQALDQTFVGPGVSQQITLQLAVEVLQSQKKDVNQQNVTALMQNAEFQQLVQQQLAQMPLLQPVYPKFYVFSAKSFELQAAQMGIQTADDLIAFIDAALAPPSPKAAPAPTSTPTP